MSTKEEFNQTLREIATLVMTVFAWGIILIIALAVIVNVYTTSFNLIFVVKDGMILVMLVGVFLALERIYKLVYALPDEDQE